MSKGKGDLFIVDNGEGGWSGLRYLEEWAGIAHAFDIATGYFDIAALLALDGKWQQLDRIRILMGTETTAKTKAVIRKEAQDVALAVLDRSLEDEKAADPFLTGVPAIVEALRSGQIEVRVYDRQKFHAKAYITHSRLEVVGSQALVGSSNFTRPGLTENVELNIRIEASNDVEDLQEWFEAYWNQATDVTALVVEAVYRHTHLYTPFDVYAKALHEYFGGRARTADEFDLNESQMFPRLDLYQKEAYWALMKIADQHGGAFLCDGVGLGKTFVGLMLIERMVRHEDKRVVLLAPKGAREGVWDPHLRQYLPDIAAPGASDFSTLAVFNHTDLSRTMGDYPERFKRMAELADVVIIDEAHHFRNPGRLPKDGIEPSRYYKLFDLLDPEVRPKTLFMLTATPVNNRLSDFRHMVELFTRRDQKYFQGALGVPDLRSHFNQMEKELRAELQRDDLSDDLAEAQQQLESSPIFDGLVVQRSRAYARESQLREGGAATVFPERKPPTVAEYSIRKSYGGLLEIFEQAFAREKPLFALPMYYPLAWYRGDDASIDPFEENRQKQVVGLIRIQFLKRFESSVAAFTISCDRLLKKLLAFAEVHSETESEKGRLDRWKRQNEELLKYADSLQLEFWADPPDEEPDAGDGEDDIVPPEMLEAVVRLDRAEYDVPQMLAETFLDLDGIIKFLAETRKFEPKHDDKLQKLSRLLKSKALADRKVLIFTEYADTARYLDRELRSAGIKGIAQVDSGRKISRADVITRFSPFYNRSASADLVADGKEEIRVLISTDVLAEGLNLQDATRMINYDIHWNPVRLMQRIGRVDRRLDPEIEARLIAAHPEVAADRGVVEYWNFLPPAELDDILRLYSTVSHKTLRISKTFGIEGRQFLTPEDDFAALKEFNQGYEGTASVVEEMLLEYRALLDAEPQLEAQLEAFPGSVFSGREVVAEATAGVFFCYRLPALDRELGEFTREAGTTRWYFAPAGADEILEDPSEIVDSIRSERSTERSAKTPRSTLGEIRGRVEKHIKNSYLKRVDAPIGVEARLECWMEVNEA